jgi:hypothetical protein
MLQRVTPPISDPVYTIIAEGRLAGLLSASKSRTGSIADQNVNGSPALVFKVILGLEPHGSEAGSAWFFVPAFLCDLPAQTPIPAALLWRPGWGQ